MILSPGATLELPLQAIQPRAPKTSSHSSHSKSGTSFKDAERDAIVRALRDSDGVIAGPKGAAARLGLRRTTLQSKMRKLGIRRPSY